MAAALSSANEEVNKMKKMKQFEDANLELILFGFDVLTTSGIDDDSESEPYGPSSGYTSGTNMTDNW